MGMCDVDSSSTSSGLVNCLSFHHTSHKVSMQQRNALFVQSKGPGLKHQHYQPHFCLSAKLHLPVDAHWTEAKAAGVHTAPDEVS